MRKKQTPKTPAQSLSALQKDPRVTAPLISWKVLLVLFGILYIFTVLAVLIYSAFFDQLGTLVAMFVYYLGACGLVFAVLIGIIWRQVIGKPIRKVATAARKVASGDFSVQIKNERKDGKKNEIDILIDDFNTMARELRGNEVLKNDFISNVSHEMKTPLSVILSYTKALKDGKVAPEERENYMDVVISTAEKLNGMIGNILKLSKLENQQIFPVAKPYQLGEQLRSCALAFMPKWEEKGIDFEIDVIDISVNYDASLLELVWNNLLSNAVKFTERGGKITLTSQKTETGVSVSVKDTGCGMDEENLKKIYEKFYQGDSSHAADGNGLGLALAKKVVDICGESISAESSLGKGTVFTVELKI